MTRRASMISVAGRGLVPTPPGYRSNASRIQGHPQDPCRVGTQVGRASVARRSPVRKSPAAGTRGRWQTRVTEVLLHHGAPTSAMSESLAERSA